MLNGLMPFIASMPGNQPGDVKKGVKVMIDVLTQEGEAKDKKIEGPKQGAWALTKEDEPTFSADGIVS
jgi:hypothetical protein